MQKLFNADLLDIFPTEDGFVYACKEKVNGSDDAIGFFSYNKTADIFDRIPVNKYIELKFGEDGYRLARDLGDFVTCKIIVMGTNKNIASYPDGKIKVFDDYSVISQTHKVDYLSSDCSIAELEGDSLWMSVPEQNAIVKYSIDHRRVEFRIGSKNEKAFSRPLDPVCYDNYLYVCNASSYKINTVSLNSFTVKDYALFNEPVYKYMRINDCEYVWLESGFYEL